MLFLLKINKVKSMPNVYSVGTKKGKRKANRRKITVNLIIFTSLFLLAWTPYAIVSLITAFFSSNLITPLGSLIPALFAKSSMAIGPIFYIFSSKHIYSKIFKKSIIRTRKSIYELF